MVIYLKEKKVYHEQEVVDRYTLTEYVKCMLDARGQRTDVNTVVGVIIDAGLIPGFK